MASLLYLSVAEGTLVVVSCRHFAGTSRSTDFGFVLRNCCYDRFSQNESSIFTWMKRLLAFGTIALTLAACGPNQKGGTLSTSTKPSIQEVYKSSETLNGTALKFLRKFILQYLQGNTYFKDSINCL